LALLVVLTGMSWFARAPYQTLAYADRLDLEIHRLSPQVKNVSAQETELDKWNRRSTMLNAQFQNRDASLEALRELSRILQPDTWISSYSYQDSTISLTGLAASAAQVQKALEDSPVFKDAQLASAITKDPSGKDRFSIRVSLEQP